MQIDVLRELRRKPGLPAQTVVHSQSRFRLPRVLGVQSEVAFPWVSVIRSALLEAGNLSGDKVSQTVAGRASGRTEDARSERRGVAVVFIMHQVHAEGHLMASAGNHDVVPDLPDSDSECRAGSRRRAAHAESTGYGETEEMRKVRIGVDAHIFRAEELR